MIDEVDGELVNRWTVEVDYPSEFILNVEIKRLLDTKSAEKVDAVIDGRPAISSITIAGEKRQYRYGPSDVSTTSDSFRLKGGSTRCEVEVVYESGTTPVLDVTLTDPPAKDELAKSRRGMESR